MKLEELKVYQDEDFGSMRKDIDTIGLKLNNYINSIGKKANK